MAVGAEVASGAIGAGGEIAAAAVDIVQTAAESIANVATGGAREGSAENPTRKGRGGRRKS
jgi:hypothetical protein